MHHLVLELCFMIHRRELRNFKTLKKFEQQKKMINLNYFLLLSAIALVDAKLNCDCSPNLDDRVINGVRAGNVSEINLNFIIKTCVC